MGKVMKETHGVFGNRTKTFCGLNRIHENTTSRISEVTCEECLDGYTEES